MLHTHSSLHTHTHTHTHSKTMEEKPVSWKKLSAVSQASANPGTMGVKMHRSYHLNDEDETEVDMDDVAKGSPCMIVFSPDYKSNNKLRTTYYETLELLCKFNDYEP